MRWCQYDFGMTKSAIVSGLYLSPSYCHSEISKLKRKNMLQTIRFGYLVVRLHYSNY